MDSEIFRRITMKIPYSPTEVQVTETYPASFFGPGPKKYKTPISPKENYRLLYERKLPLWIPTMSDMTMISPRIDPDNVARVLVMDTENLTPEESVGGPDKFGIDWVYVPSAGGSMVKPGSPVLKDVNDWEKIIKFPDVDKWDWEHTREVNKDLVTTDRFLSLTFLTGFFERLISFMDFENAAVALIDEDQQTAVHGLFSALADCYIKILDHFFDVYPVDCLSFHDDWGSQRSPFFSLGTAMEMIVPYIKRIVDHCHANGVFYDQHSCGKNEKLVPAYIASGADSWSGQTMNDKQWIYDNYGDKIILGIEPDIPFDFMNPIPIDPAEAVASAKRFVAKFGPNYATKPVIPGFFGAPEFTDALYEESRKLFYDLANE
jgi:hypothetical protein